MVSSRYTVFFSWHTSRHEQFYDRDALLKEGPCSVVLIMGMEGLPLETFFTDYLIDYPITMRPTTSYILIYRAQQPNLLSEPVTLYQYPAKVFLLHVTFLPDGPIQSTLYDLYVYCALCRVPLLPVEDFQPLPQLEPYWDLDNVGVRVIEWQLLTTNDLTVQNVANHYNFSKALHYNSQPGGNLQGGNVYLNPRETLSAIPGIFLSTIGTGDIFYCAGEYVRRGNLSKIEVWVFPFDAWTWFSILATISFSSLVIVARQNVYKLTGHGYMSNLSVLIRELVRQPAPNKRHFIITLVSIVFIFLLLSYENYITSRLVAPMKRPLFRSLAGLLDNGYKLNYPQDLKTSAVEIKQWLPPSLGLSDYNESLIEGFFYANYEEDLKFIGIKNFKTIRNQLIFKALTGRNLAEINLHEKYAIVESQYTGYKLLMETAFPARKCYTVDRLSKIPIFNVFRMQGQEDYAKLVSYMREAGIHNFWDDLFKFRYSYFYRGVMKVEQFPEIVDTGMITLSDLDASLISVVTLLSAGCTIFLVECRTLMSGIIKVTYQKVRVYVTLCWVKLVLLRSRLKLTCLLRQPEALRNISIRKFDTNQEFVLLPYSLEVNILDKSGLASSNFISSSVLDDKLNSKIELKSEDKIISPDAVDVLKLLDLVDPWHMPYPDLERTDTILISNQWDLELALVKCGRTVLVLTESEINKELRYFEKHYLWLTFFKSERSILKGQSGWRLVTKGISVTPQIFGKWHVAGIIQLLGSWPHVETPARVNITRKVETLVGNWSTEPVRRISLGGNLQAIFYIYLISMYINIYYQNFSRRN
ncbi:hypothetical protein Fcan01_26598 [Folsomia candida]|uniref:Uncharacterized protein n=1 Tax=Folsomia candida TaxID=158441 RepID=A0A226D374_FOLCA|nr:hypothetical protein Fcan01_26598 [Folsomia candida]